MRKRTSVALGMGLLLAVVMANPAMALQATIPQADQVWLMAADLYKGTNGGDTGYYYGDTMGLVKYNLSSLAPPDGYTLVISSATLRLWTSGTYQGNFTDGLYAAGDNWTFATVSWANRPTRGSLLGSWTYPGINSPVDIDVTSYVQSEVNGDQIATVWIEDIDATGTDWHYYYTYPGAWCEAKITVNYTLAPNAPVETPVITPGTGSYSSAQSVTITCPTTGATIRYTLDGTTPTSSSAVYTSALTVSGSTTLKAVGFKTGHAASNIAKAVYTFPAVGTVTELLTTYDAQVGEVSQPVINIITNNYYGACAGYLMYDLSELPTPPEGSSITINSVTLTFFGNSSQGPDNYTDGLFAVEDNSWTDSMTWADRPAMGNILLGWDFPGAWIQATLSPSPTLTSYVQTKFATPEKLVSFGVQPEDGPWPTGPWPSTDAHFYFRNYGVYTSYSFKLRIDYSFSSLPATATPVITPDNGSYTTPQTVTITADSGATIRYTLDGSDPTAASPIYGGPFTVSTGTKVRAIAITAGHSYSAIAKVEYTFPAKGDLVDIVDLYDACVYTPGGTVGKATDGLLNTGVYGPSLTYHSYLMYDLSAVPELTPPAGYSLTINSASVYGYATGNASRAFQDAYFAVADNSWTEASITLENRPTPGNLLVAWDPIDWNLFTAPSPALTDYVVAAMAGDKRVSFYLQSAVSLWSPTVGIITHSYYDKDGPGLPDYTKMKLRVDYSYTKLPSAATPTFSPKAGKFWQAQTVTISTTTPGATIRYTTDGNDPDAGSPLYDNVTKVTISGTTTLKAVAFAPPETGLYQSDPGVALYDFPTLINAPTDVPQGSVAVDGNLADWAGSEWAPLDQDYDGSATDISQAFYSVKWTANKVYVAVKVRDTQHHFTDNYTDWNVHDAVEVYIHTIGSGPTNYSDNQTDAQEYTIGMKPDGVNFWSVIGYAKAIPSAAGFQAAAKVNGDWLCYEAAVTPFEFFSDGLGLIESPLSVGVVTGIDVCAVSTNSAGGYLGMKSENPMTGKSGDYRQIGVHNLVTGSPFVATQADLAAVLAAMDTTAASGSTWNVAADFDSDGEVTSSDLSFVLKNLP